ncbi:MAG: hypothetical protein ACOCU8_01170 [Patescibacteria group bacterium]
MKKLSLQILFSLTVLILVWPAVLVLADTTETIDTKAESTIYFFDDRLCPTCQATKDFIQETITEDYPQVNLVIYPISDTERLYQKVEEYQIEDFRLMAPTVFIGDNFFQFLEFGPQEEEKIIQALEGQAVETDSDLIITIPFINKEINLAGWSLPILSFILGSIDGFNVCSIGALVLILSIVVIFDSKKKIFFFGGLFIFTTVLVYGLLVFAWGKLFELLLGHLEILRIIVGLAALGGGLYFLKEFWRFFRYGPTCQASDNSLIKKATLKLKNSFESGRGILVLAGSVVFFAFVVTVVELPCSIGVPIAFTGILVEQEVSLIAYIFYILIYLFFYMLIELIIFTGAVLTKKIWFAGSRLITWITFIGAIILFYLAYYYLMF